MNPIQRLEAHGQSVWLDDDFDGDLVASGRLRRCIDGLCVSGLTSQRGGREGGRYRAVRRGSDGEAAEDVLFSLVADDVRAAADVFLRCDRPVRGSLVYCSGIAPRRLADGAAEGGAEGAGGAVADALGDIGDAGFAAPQQVPGDRHAPGEQIFHRRQADGAREAIEEA